MGGLFYLTVMKYGVVILIFWHNFQFINRWRILKIISDVIINFCNKKDVKRSFLASFGFERKLYSLKLSRINVRNADR